jgi:hypothetical protein
VSATLTSLIAVLGTLAGGSLTGYIQSRTARVQREDTHRRTQQDNAVNAFAEFVAAVDKHRGVMWEAEKRRFPDQVDGTEPRRLPNGADEVDSPETRASRADVSAPLHRFCLLVPALAEQARQLARATYAIRSCPTRKELDIRRQAAHDAMTEFVTTASVVFRRAGIGLALPPGTGGTTARKPRRAWTPDPEVTS